MLPGVAFLLYLAVGCIFVILFLLICVRVSVFIEDTCPIRFCLRRKQRKLRKLLIRDMLFPNTGVDPDSPRPAPPSDENITADIICQPYIYRDAYSTGLTQLSGLSLLANLPLTVALSDGNPSDAIVTSQHSEQMRVMRLNYRRTPRQSSTENSSQLANHNAEIIVEAPDSPNNEPTDNDGDAVAEIHSLPPDYANAINDTSLAATQSDNLNTTNNAEDITLEISGLPPDYTNATNNTSSNRLDNELSNGNLNDEPPPPSYYECVKLGTKNTEENGNLNTSYV